MLQIQKSAWVRVNKLAENINENEVRASRAYLIWTYPSSLRTTADRTEDSALGAF